MEPEVQNLEPVAVRRATAARMLEVSVTTVWRLVQEGKLETVKIGADDRITVASIRRFGTVRADQT